MHDSPDTTRTEGDAGVVPPPADEKSPPEGAQVDTAPPADTQAPPPTDTEPPAEAIPPPNAEPSPTDDAPPMDDAKASEPTPPTETVPSEAPPEVAPDAYRDGRYGALQQEFNQVTDLAERLREQVIDNSLRACGGLDFVATMDEGDIALACSLVPGALRADTLALVHSIAKNGKPDAAFVETGKLGLWLARMAWSAAIDCSPYADLTRSALQG